MVDVKTLVLEVEDLTCPSCAQGLETAFKSIQGVVEVKLSFASGRLRVVYDDTQTGSTVIHRAIKRAGYKAKEVSVS